MRRWLVGLLLVLLALPLAAQRGGGFRGGGFGGRFLLGPGTPPVYDGRFTLARLYYGSYPGWSYDWPDMESHLGRILDDLTSLRPTHDLNNVLRMDDPALMKFPVAYLSEPGYWFPTDAEATGLRTYLAKGGFLIVDDFHFANEWAVFETAMRQVLPGVRIERLDLSHPVFNSFFPIKSLKRALPRPPGRAGTHG